MNFPQTSGERIRFARRMLGLTRKNIEDQFQLSSNTLQAWESGRIQLTLKGAHKLNEIFVRLGLMCSDEWLINGKGQPPILLNNLSSLAFEITEDLCILREIEAFHAINPNPITVIISDNGMEPLYKVGEYVGGNKQMGDKISHLIGENCIVESLQGDIFVRKLLQGSKEPLYNLACINMYTDQQPLITDIKIRFAAQIVLHRKKENKNNS